ncbi:MAG: diadenylate cyclase [Acidimicrobiales bacterium]
MESRLVAVDPVGAAVAHAVTDILGGATVEVSHARVGTPPASPPPTPGPGTAMATGEGPDGWQTSVIVRLDDRVARLVGPAQDTSLAELLHALPGAAVAAATQFRAVVADDTMAMAISPALQRAVRDAVASEVLAVYLATRVAREVHSDLVGETIEYLVELSGMRVESHHLTHGVIIADVFPDRPRLRFRYPHDIRAAKRAPLLFDGRRAMLVVDPDGRARTELQRHRVQRLAGRTEPARVENDDWVESGALVAEATRALGGLGFYVRGDRSIWTFVDGRPLLIRRAEHWTAFPLQLSASIENMIGGGTVAGVVARAAVLISAQPGGAILAVVDDQARLEGIVSPKDRYDLRNDIDPDAMRPETRLHHLIDAEQLDEHTLVRLAMLDGATVLDRHGRLLAYGAIVTTTDSQHEGARTAAARTLSETAAVVLKVSIDGDITIFRDGHEVTTLLGHPRAE